MLAIYLLCGASTATKNTNNMLLRWKYCSIDDTKPSTYPHDP